MLVGNYLKRGHHGQKDIIVSLKSIWPMLSRYMHYIIGFAWFPLCFFSIMTLLFGFSFSKLAPKPTTSGCHSIDEDFINCTSIREEEMSELILNFRYQFFVHSIFVMTFLMESAVLMFLQLSLLKIEHRNGKFYLNSYFNFANIFMIVRLVQYRCFLLCGIRD